MESVDIEMLFRGIYLHVHNSCILHNLIKEFRYFDLHSVLSESLTVNLCLWLMQQITAESVKEKAKKEISNC